MADLPPFMRRDRRVTGREVDGVGTGVPAHPPAPAPVCDDEPAPEIAPTLKCPFCDKVATALRVVYGPIAARGLRIPYVLAVRSDEPAPPAWAYGCCKRPHRDDHRLFCQPCDMIVMPVPFQPTPEDEGFIDTHPPAVPGEEPMTCGTFMSARVRRWDCPRCGSYLPSADDVVPYASWWGELAERQRARSPWRRLLSRLRR